MTPPPTVLAGKYRLTEPIGHGGMGTVWRAEHLGFGAPVAIKLIDPKILAAPGALRRFQNEARAAATLRSPHVVQVLDYGVDEATGSPFIAMELLEGVSLDRRLREQHTLSPAEAARLVTHVSRALSRAHESGIVHRDLKPANIFLIRNDDEEIAKVLDFGTARLAVPDKAAWTDTNTQAGAVIGTPRYMSPEQISGGEVDHRSDLWALGVIAAECLTGVPLFRAREMGGLVLQICSHPMPVPSELGPVPAGFDEWFARATSRDVRDRYQVARALAEDLQRLCGPTVGLSASGSGEAALPSGGGKTPVPPSGGEREPVTPRAATITAASTAVTTPAGHLKSMRLTAPTRPIPITRELPLVPDNPPSALDPIVRPSSQAGTTPPPARAGLMWRALGLVVVLGALILAMLVRERAPGLARARQGTTADEPEPEPKVSRVAPEPPPLPPQVAPAEEPRASTAVPAPSAAVAPTPRAAPPPADREGSDPAAKADVKSELQPESGHRAVAPEEGAVSKHKRKRGRTHRTTPVAPALPAQRPAPPLGAVLDQRH